MLNNNAGPSAKLANREREAGPYLPYTRHVNNTVVALRSGLLMTTIELKGVPFETSDRAELNIFHNHLNMLWRSIGKEQLALWSHMVRRRDRDYPIGKFKSKFAADLDRKYQERMVGEALYRNRWFLTLVWSPAIDRADKVLNFLSRFHKPSMSDEVDHRALKELDDTCQTAIAALERYEPRVLGLYRGNNELMFSEPMEFLRLVGTSDEMPMPLVDGPIGGAVYADRVLFGKENIEIRLPDESKLAGILGIKEYPSKTRPGMLNAILSAKMECVLAQSFAFIAKSDAKQSMALKQGQMINANDRAASQIDELDVGLDDLESNRMVMGMHHLNLMVLGHDSVVLRENIGLARRILSECGIVTAREDLALETSYWGLFPGNFSHRPRSGAISSRNFAALSGFHSHPSGEKKAHWGMPVALLKTAAGGAYNFNFHVGDLGNTFICGPSGSGKTVIQNFMLAQLQKHDATMVFFDKDRGADIFVRAAGGNYLPLKSGQKTGCAPLQALDFDHAGDFEFLHLWIKKLVERPDKPFTVTEEGQIHTALSQMRAMPRELRRLGNLRDFFPSRDPEGIGARLERWFGTGALSWAFDHGADDIALDASLVGFDMTEFLDNPEIRTPLMMYLFHRVERLIDGRRIVIDIDEFWKALDDEAFRQLARDKLKTIRKQNGMMLFGTQSPRDALQSEIGYTIIEQCPTKIFMPNPYGSHEDYVGGFKLSEREFELISQELTPESRCFLIKQGRNSVVASLDLGGFDDELKILSGRTESIARMDELIVSHGSNPEVWLPHLLGKV
ncbi:VirB4 family type IV secretion/conjugal transfer ATPase [Neorhizobium sp. T786]|uniref:VirB4 family type IV secretion/conjugal transfer ATPase n=1 Tax=Pseudorhizobium xiangyangii TaxID=2883104 RepID=UPI001CFFD393|nr:VirB4 family type IV secretion/conjugal transfer ATPase [Neorhizobium xiangyangii]MCB5205162.1 VirB4 family type IV secretion/conjugal transfer ATPase [Neorhizobium xiangyangii]